MLVTTLATAVLATASLLQSCQQHGTSTGNVNAVYYWRTELRLDSTERHFLRHHDVRRIYCRYFDVVMRGDDEGDPSPNATIAFADTVPPGIEVVPTVFMTEDCMHRPHKGLARRIVSRIAQMNETHGIRGVREIQLDCDYTARSRKRYYDFLEEARREAREQGMRLSVTIRLHQLSMPAPPADEGVLMLYNTGDPMRLHERNPILDMRDVKPYLSHLRGYGLPLAAAYPVFCWQRTLFGTHVEHQASIGEILRVKQAVEDRRPALRRTILCYHLDHENIQRYTLEDYEAIFHH